MAITFEDQTQLKVCGVTTQQDAELLVERGVKWVGFNFWQKSKRYLAPEAAVDFAPEYRGKLTRVGVFVNAEQAEVLRMFALDLIDIAQFHGDESIEYCQQFKQHNLPFIKAIGVANADSLDQLEAYQADAILLDAHAPEVYGGTGDTFDWNLAKQVQLNYPDLPLILAGGITSENAYDAVSFLSPQVIDVASGAEISPGIKDREKIMALQQQINRSLTP